MPTCANCKQQNQTIDHIKTCFDEHYAGLKTAEVTGLAADYIALRQATDFKPMALSPYIPISKYALSDEDGLAFYEVTNGTGKWDGIQFLSRLYGAPGDWRRIPMKGFEKRKVMALILEDARGAAVRYSKEFTVCAACGSPLSDPQSRERGLGPVCWSRFD